MAPRYSKPTDIERRAKSRFAGLLVCLVGESLGVVAQGVVSYNPATGVFQPPVDSRAKRVVAQRRYAHSPISRPPMSISPPPPPVVSNHHTMDTGVLQRIEAMLQEQNLQQKTERSKNMLRQNISKLNQDALDCEHLLRKLEATENKLKKGRFGCSICNYYLREMDMGIQASLHRGQCKCALNNYVLDVNILYTATEKEKCLQRWKKIREKIAEAEATFIDEDVKDDAVSILDDDD